MTAPRTNAATDQNFQPTLLGVSTTDGFTPVAIEVDPVTGAMLISGTTNLSPTATGGWKPYFASAVTTPIVVSAVPGKFGGYMLINLNSAPAYIQVFDTIGAVTLGTTAPTFVIPIPANATPANGLAANLELANGVSLTNGLVVAVTTTASGSTVVNVGLSGTIWYK